MNAEIIAVGSELLTSSRIDTNSLWLTDQLNSIGVEVVSKSVIGDDRQRLAIAVRTAAERSDIIVTTGGLGPTEDDVTRDAVAQAFVRNMVWRQEICDEIEARFQRTGRKMADINRRQAFVIEGAEVLPNPNGTAPGQWLEPDSKAVMTLPGPPREMRPMFEQHCLPRLRRIVPVQAIRTRLFRVAGMPESDLDQLISPVYKKYENPVTTVLASPGDIQIHLRARCESPDEADRLLDEVAGQIEELLGDRVYTRRDETLQATVGQMLRDRGATLTVAESYTGGLLAARITATPGASDYLRGGFLVYSAELKQSLLGVGKDLIEEHTVVSREVAEAMAAGARERTNATYALATTGEAGPESATGKPVGLVYLALAGPEGVKVERYQFPGDRDLNRRVGVQWSLNLLRRQLAQSL